MSNFIERVTNSLKNEISELADNRCLFLRNPSTDFSRNRKIDFKTFIGITMNSGGCTMGKELLDYFNFDTNTPTVSAYTQQRAKVLPEAFEYLFKSFTAANNRNTHNYRGFKLIACDGSNLSIAYNPNDSDTSWVSNQYGDTANHLHLNAFYDVFNRIYLDVIIQTASEYQETRACVRMIERSDQRDVILVADRGYENYNIMAHADQKGWKYVIRVKDVNSNGIASALDLPHAGSFDTDVTLTFTRKNNKKTKAAGYRWMPQNQMFDYLPPKSEDTYTLPFRIARFKISDENYEVVVTNLDRSQFPSKNLKEIYQLRWGIEQSYRSLKYALSLSTLHSVKREYIVQEVYAKLTMYNFTSLLARTARKNLPSRKKGNKWDYRVSFSNAASVAQKYLYLYMYNKDLLILLLRAPSAVHPGKKNPRVMQTQSVRPLNNRG